MDNCTKFQGFLFPLGFRQERDDALMLSNRGEGRHYLQRCGQALPWRTLGSGVVGSIVNPREEAAAKPWKKSMGPFGSLREGVVREEAGHALVSFSFHLSCVSAANCLPHQEAERKGGINPTIQPSHLWHPRGRRLERSPNRWKN